MNRSQGLMDDDDRVMILAPTTEHSAGWGVSKRATLCRRSRTRTEVHKVLQSTIAVAARTPFAAGGGDAGRC